MLIEKLQNRLAQPLPGLEIQMQMAPAVRKWDYELPKTVKYSAVLVLLYPYKEELHIVFMKRPDDGSTHAGQVSFPGGKKEEEDADFSVTAVREAQEEVGVIPEKVRLLGALSPLYIPPSNYLVYPFVGYVEERPDFVPQAKEVAKIIEVPLSYLLKEEIRTERKVPMSGMKDVLMNAPCFQLEEDFIWGGTAMMLSEFSYILKEIE